MLKASGDIAVFSLCFNCLLISSLLKKVYYCQLDIAAINRNTHIIIYPLLHHIA